jgi:tetratricopeptide (TPR) repeat protein
MRRVFRDYKVLLVSNRLTLGSYEDMLEPFQFGHLKTTHDDQKALNMIRRLKPDFIVASRSIGVFSGAQLLSAVREESSLDRIPFLVIGDKKDLKPGGLAEQVERARLAGFAAMPLGRDEFTRIVLELLDPLIDTHQEEAYAHFDEGARLAGIGETRQAMEAYQQGINLYDGNIEALIGLAGLLADLHDVEAAEATFFKALRLNNYSLEAYFGLAELYERNQDYEQTIGILNQALGIAKILKVSDSSVSRINFFIGEFELRLKRLTGAGDSFNRAIELSPDDPELRVDIGDAYASKGYWEESEDHYTAALTIDPNLAHVFNRLGIAYRRQAKYKKALQLYDQARMHHPDDEHLLFNIARVHFETSHHQDAEMFLEEALLMSPEFKEAHFLISKLKAVTMQDVSKTKEMFDP